MLYYLSLYYFSYKIKMFIKRVLNELRMINGTIIEKSLNLSFTIDPKTRPRTLLTKLHTKNGINEFIRMVNLP